MTSFPMAVKRKEDETVVFSWIIWPSREVRNEGTKFMADPRHAARKEPDALGRETHDLWRI